MSGQTTSTVQARVPWVRDQSPTGDAVCGEGSLIGHANLTRIIGECPEFCVSGVI